MTRTPEAITQPHFVKSIEIAVGLKFAIVFFTLLLTAVKVGHKCAVCFLFTALHVFLCKLRIYVLNLYSRGTRFESRSVLSVS
jgi:hypothetical protein